MTKPDKADADVQAQAHAWLMHLRSGKVTAEDLQEFRRWCAEHPQMASTLRETWGTLRAVGEHVSRQETALDSAWKGSGGRVHAFRPGRRAFAGFALAAGASWLALRPPLQLWPSVSELGSDYRTGTGEQRRVTLADGVTVDMNTQTRINVLPASAHTGTGEGIDLLSGEAEVAMTASNARPIGQAGDFVVVAGKGRLQARLARFNVRRTGAQVCVTCVSGTVAFEHPQQRLTLMADQQLVYDDRGVQSTTSADPAAVTAWRRGVLIFNGIPLTQVVDEINRYRPGKVILRNAALGGNTVQAQAPIARLDDLIDTLSKVYGAHITKLPGGIVLLA